MSITRLILSEIRKAKGNFLLCLFTVVFAVGVFVALLSMSRAATRDATILMRDIGFNILIVPGDMPMERYWTLDFADAEMPEATVNKLADSDVAADHFVGKLQKTILIGDRAAILTGVRPETPKGKGTAGKAALPQSYDVPAGSIFLGSAAASAAGVSSGGGIDILGRRFTVARVLDKTGTADDIRAFARLRDVQALLGKPGRINAIDALGCRCGKGKDFLAVIEEGIRRVLPSAQVHHYRSIAVAREAVRQMFDRYAFYTFAVVLFLGATSIAGFTFSNVRRRRYEVGILRAVGLPSYRIAGLFLGKIALYSLTGAALGFFLGTAAAGALGPALVKTPVRPDWILLPAGAIAAPVLALIFGLLPIAYGLTLDPATVLHEE